MNNQLRLTDVVNVDLEVWGQASGRRSLVYWGPDYQSGGRWRALKTWKPGIWKSRPRAREMLLHGAFNGMELWPHPNLVPTEDIVSIGDYLYIVQPYASHGNLRDRMRQKLPLAEAIRIMHMVAAGLEELHTPDPDIPRDWIAYGNLRPKNVLFNDEGLAQLSDIGGTSYWSSEGGGLTLIGPADDADSTLAYLAPEWPTWVSEPTREGDMYAFGALMYEALTGRRPAHRPAHRSAHQASTLSGAPGVPVASPPGPQHVVQPMPPGVPEILEDFCQRCLSHLPRSRPTVYEAGEVLKEASRVSGQPPYVVKDGQRRTPAQKVVVGQRLARVFARFGYPTEALQQIERVLALDPTRPEALAQWAQILAGKGLVDDALHAFEIALAAQPPENRASMAELLGSRAIMLGKTTRYEEAEQAFSEALAVAQDDAELWRQRAINQLGQVDAAVQTERLTDVARHLNLAIEFAQKATELGSSDPGLPQLISFMQSFLSTLDDPASPPR